MKNRKIPTILGILILVIGIAAGVYLVQNRQIFRLQASPEITPKDIRQTNISDSSFTVSWTTDKKVNGFITWSENDSNLDKTATQSQDGELNIHTVTVHGLAANSTYFYKINSGGEEFDNEGIPWQISTGPQLPVPTESIVISGKIITQEGTPADSAVVYASAGGSSLLSTTTSDNGSWVIPISLARTQNLSTYVDIDESNTVVEIFVQAAPLGVSSAQIYPASAKPAPDIVIGETHDFKNLQPEVDEDVPDASVELPSNATESSKFSIPNGVAETTAEAVVIESVSEGEVINTTEPDFFGEGPPGTEITITVESEPQTSLITVDEDGSWSWNPQNELEEGIHKVTLSWRDSSGILRTLTRSFIVSAQEGPAFVATPSASPTPTAIAPTNTPTPTPSPTTTGALSGTPSPTITPTPSPTRTPSPRPTSTATDSALPDAGVSAPTILLAIIGIALVSFGAFILSVKGDKTLNS